jgi:hypothetical protein
MYKSHSRFLQARQTVESRFSWATIAEFAWQSYTILSRAFR